MRTWIGYKNRTGRYEGMLIAEDVTHMAIRKTKVEGETEGVLHIWVTVGRGDAQGIFIISDPEIPDDDGWASLWDKLLTFATQVGGPEEEPLLGD